MSPSVRRAIAIFTQGAIGPGPKPAGSKTMVSSGLASNERHQSPVNATDGTEDCQGHLMTAE
jgi:hypothetical protein